MPRLRLLSVLMVMLVCQARAASSPKEYATLARIAAADLINDPQTPPALRFWMEEALGSTWDRAKLREFYLNDRVGRLGAGLSGMAYWSVAPDLVAASDEGRLIPVEPFGVPERALHYLDMERLNTNPRRQVFLPDLTNKPAFRDIPREMHDVRYAESGMLPFRAQQCYDRLVDAIVARRLVDKPGVYPRDDHAVRWAGYLAHYIADSWQPQHATMDYRMNGYFPEQKKLPDVQAEFEGRLCDDGDNDFPALRDEYWAALESALKRAGTEGPPFQSRDAWDMSVQALLYSYDFLPLIGEAAGRSYNAQAQCIETDSFYHHRGKVGQKEMTVLEAKAQLQALAVRQISLAWLRAWEDASRRIEVPAATQPAEPAAKEGR